MVETEECKCGEESTKGCYGIRNDEIYSEYYCDACFAKRNDKKPKEKKVNVQPSV